MKMVTVDVLISMAYGFGVLCALAALISGALWIGGGRFLIALMLGGVACLVAWGIGEEIRGRD